MLPYASVWRTAGLFDRHPRLMVVLIAKMKREMRTFVD